MNKKTLTNTIIYKDKPAQGHRYFSILVLFTAMATAVAWFIGLYFESIDYRSSADFGFLIFVFSLACFLGWLLWKKIKALVDIGREKPLIKIHDDGIAIMDDRFRPWTDIEYIRLVSRFDQKHIELKCLKEENNINYMLYSPWETSEFENFEKLKEILDIFMVKVLIEK